MHHGRFHLGLFLLIILPACTDRRPKLFSNQISKPPESAVSLVATVQFDQKPTSALQMVVTGSSLFLTGRPFGFARWDVGSDPESPRLTFAASDNIETFSPYPKFGFWTPDSFAQGALDLYGKSALMSGAAGLSVVDISETHTPVEKARFPAEKIDGVSVTRDSAFVYSAIAHHPTLSVIYGFAEQDVVYTLAAGNPIRILEKAAYADSSVCCAMGASVAGNRVLLAMRQSLWVFDLQPDGRLGASSELDSLQAVNVVTTASHIYVQHEPTVARSSGAGNPAGIYVFDAEGSPVGYLPIQPIRFAVYQDEYIYANLSNTEISIFKIR